MKHRIWVASTRAVKKFEIIQMKIDQVIMKWYQFFWNMLYLC